MEPATSITVQHSFHLRMSVQRLTKSAASVPLSFTTNIGASFVVVMHLHGLIQVLGVKVRGGHAYQILVGQIARHLATPDGHHRG